MHTSAGEVLITMKVQVQRKVVAQLLVTATMQDSFIKSPTFPHHSLNLKKTVMSQLL